jgi:hypothetical protein
MSTAWKSAAVAAASGLLFAIGDSNGASLDTIEAFDPSTARWTNKTSMPLPLSHLGAATIGGVIYVFDQSTTLQYTPADDIL